MPLCLCLCLCIIGVCVHVRHLLVEACLRRAQPFELLLVRRLVAPARARVRLRELPLVRDLNLATQRARVGAELRESWGGVWGKAGGE